jgi:hypothetical protein
MIPPDGQVRIQAIGIVLADETKPLRASIDALQARIAELENELKEREHKGDWRPWNFSRPEASPRDGAIATYL